MSEASAQAQKDHVSAQFMALAMSAVIAVGGITFKLVLDRIDKQELTATADIAALREEIKSTKSDSKDAVAAAAAASKDAVAATANALRESVAAAALAAKDSVAASAVSSKEAVSATAVVLSDKIEVLNNRIALMEPRLMAMISDNTKALAAQGSAEKQLMEKFAEVETQFFWATDAMNMRTRDLDRTMSLLWQRVYKEPMPMMSLPVVGPSRK